MIDVEKSLSHLSELHLQHLETDIVEQLAARLNLDAEEALAIYYKSRLARQVAAGSYGIQNLDAAYLVDDLLENEPELFSRAR